MLDNLSYGQHSTLIKDEDLKKAIEETIIKQSENLDQI